MPGANSWTSVLRKASWTYFEIVWAAAGWPMLLARSLSESMRMCVSPLVALAPGTRLASTAARTSGISSGSATSTAAPVESRNCAVACSPSWKGSTRRKGRLSARASETVRRLGFDTTMSDTAMISGRCSVDPRRLKFLGKARPVAAENSASNSPSPRPATATTVTSRFLSANASSCLQAYTLLAVTSETGSARTKRPAPSGGVRARTPFCTMVACACSRVSVLILGLMGTPETVVRPGWM
mmetsp:Transcript_94655/g.267951  ORF Transcript_94655/g.267951 Transcript_94655/m.267951 type:complete len:241 (-) Transcript_94655:713-1435(-)